jgi:NADH:flavin oxidoreductases, Old Yellow Enzyme family
VAVNPIVWEPFQLGRLELSHRLALAPMTRSRANADGTPGAGAALYYRQRASLGLLITEGTQPSAVGQGYLTTPGIYTPAQVAGWREVADAVHEEGAALFIQLMHAGRISHPDNTELHAQPVAPSAIAPGTKIVTPSGLQDVPTPRALSTDEVVATIADYRHAAASAMAAGADGVEIHAANGYLPNQFLSPNANQRTDSYGGSVENRARFVIELADAIAAEIGADRVGVRISPGMKAGGLDEGSREDIHAQYEYLVAQLATRKLAYLHINHAGDDELLAGLRRLWPTALLLVRPGRPREQFGEDIAAGLADVLPLGRWALANPDVVERLRLDAGFNDPDPASFYSGGAHGYTDYPTLAAVGE